MRWLLLIALAAAQTPHGPYADKPGWHCYRGETIEKKKLAHCACKAPCDNDGYEDHACVTYCGSQACLCHTDEGCEVAR